jgi:DNA gyrase subunit A
MGVKAMKLTRTRGTLVAARAVALDDEIFVVSSDGIVNRQRVREISSQKRDTTGVRVMNLQDDAELVAVAPVMAEDEEDEG